MNSSSWAQEFGRSESNRREQLEAHIQCQLRGRVRGFRLIWRHDGLVLRGQAGSFHAKQLAQQAVMEAGDLPILANEIEVSLVGWAASSTTPQN